jgi:protein-S-isoprenylcysteine O-methyltransferase Ste14
MVEENSYRLAVLGLFVAAFPTGLYFRLRSMASGERLDRREEGWLLVPLRLCGAAFLGGVVAYVINPTWMSWAALPLPAVVRWAGLALCAAALPLMVWVMRSLGKNLTDTVATRRDATLVTHGLYRWVRHPFYGVGFLWFVGLTLLTASGFLAALGAAAFTLLVVRTATEERKLVERFGDAYREYMRRTGRFFPRLWDDPLRKADSVSQAR